MKKNYHLTNTGELKRKENTLVFEPDTNDSKNYIPVKNVDAIYAHEEIRFNTKLFKLLDNHTVELHLFSWGGNYMGGYMPTKSTFSGEVIVKQVQSYMDSNRRQNISKKMVKASIHNMIQTVRYYKGDYPVIDDIDTLESIKRDLDGSGYPIEELMGFEGDGRTIYYNAIEKIIPDEFNFETREYNPPSSEFNALLSFGNSLLYGVVSSSINATALNPTISFLHEPSARRHSLSLDIADIFKPVIVDRMVLRLVNRRQIGVDGFKDDWMLKEKPRKTVLSEFEEVLEETVKHPELERHVSYQYLIKLDVLDLKKHILTGEEYTPFKRWW